MSSIFEVIELGDSVFEGGTVPDTGETNQVRSQPALVLAPMEGVTDFATRFWLSQIASPDEATTPFLRVTRDYPSKRISANFLPEIELSKEHGIVTCIPQLMASETSDLIRIGEFFLKHVSFVDINCGCPSPTVVGNGAGSSLLKCPDKFFNYLQGVVSALGARRVSVKMRVGFQSESEFDSLLEVLKGMPLARLTIHGRTRADRYKGKARWKFIDKAARALDYPVIGSGDVLDQTSYQERLACAPSVSGIMVGRGALRNPWIFDLLRSAKPNQVKISFDLLAQRIHQFCLFQEFNCHQWPAFFSLIKTGFFSRQLQNDAEMLKEQSSHAASIVFDNKVDERLRPERWPLGRVSVARGKMLWNYLRSGVGLEPHHSVRLLRAKDWQEFVDALNGLKGQFPENELALGYHSEWDWIYAGDTQLKTEQRDSDEPTG